MPFKDVNKQREYNRNYKRKIRIENYDEVRKKEVIREKRRQLRDPFRTTRAKRERTIRFKLIVFKHYGNKCACCGLSDFNNLTIDHIIPKSKTSPNSPERRVDYIMEDIINKSLWNEYQILCFGCNTSKGVSEKCRLDHSITFI